MLLREVGAAIGIDPTILSKIECGARKPSKVQLYALAEFYNEQKNNNYLSPKNLLQKNINSLS